MRIIDLETYPRRSHYEFFKSYAYPYMGITANVDVTNLYNTAKKLGGSPFLAFLWAAANAANAVPELRQRIVDDRIVEFDHCDTAHTVALPDGTFVNCQTDCRRSFAAFQTYGRQCQEEAKSRHGFVQPGKDETSLIFVSSTPWVAFTQVIQPTPIPADSNVRIVFGKFFDQNGRKMLPVNIQCNHALVDGLHVGQFFQKMQELADSDLETVPMVALDDSMDYGKYPTLAPLGRVIFTSSGPQKVGEKKESDSVQENELWKNNILRSDELPEGVIGKKASEYAVLGSRYQRNQIKSVTFLDTLTDMPADAWDVSEAGNRSVMAWVKPNGKLYDLYIAAEGGMAAGKSCYKQFCGYVHAKHIHFGTVLRTGNVQNMNRMFESCKTLARLNLSGFDTANTEDMGGMFCDCRSLMELNLSSFDTSKVKNMAFMFSDCRSLTVLELRNFATSNVCSMHYMFSGCTLLTELDLSSFDASKVQNMSYMFSDCKSLTELDLRGFKKTRMMKSNYVFPNCPAGSRWKHLFR